MKRYLNAAEVAERLGVGLSTAYEVMRDLPRIRIGHRTVRVSEDDFAAWCAARTEAPASRSPSAARHVKAQPLKRPSASSNAPMLIRPTRPRESAP
jgi:excisionase family DNA binding protein